MNLKEKELEILRDAVDRAELKQAKKAVNTPEVKEIISIVEHFLRDKKLVCYGGTAINNILPQEDQFYDKSIEIPDYDFFSGDALKDAKELANIYYKAGYNEVEAKSGQHYGTYKVFVNFIPVADITQLSDPLYGVVKKNAIMVDGILYAPPNYLRMSMYLELSRPAGDVGRWEKVLKRLILLNKNYPLRGKKCDQEEFQRSFENLDEKKEKEEGDIYTITRNSFMDQGLVFFGGFANTLYGKYMPRRERKQLEKIPDFDVLSENPERSAVIVKERLSENGVKNITIRKHKEIGEIIPEHYEILVGKETICFIYKTTACHSYNEILISDKKVKIATIDTMLSFYLAFVYSKKAYYDEDRILCMSEYLFNVQRKNRLKQKGLLKRFSIKCYGKQPTRESMRAEKAEKYKELKDKRTSKEYESWFLRYIPAEKDKKDKKKQEKKQEKKKTRKTIGSKAKKTRKNKKKNKKKTATSGNGILNIFGF